MHASTLKGKKETCLRFSVWEPKTSGCQIEIKAEFCTCKRRLCKLIWDIKNEELFIKQMFLIFCFSWKFKRITVKKQTKALK